MNLRGAALYLRSNTFDPLLCKDIPKRLVAHGEEVVPPRTPAAADTPVQLAHQLARSARACPTAHRGEVVVDASKKREWNRIF
jgi:hypothetical protein